MAVKQKAYFSTPHEPVLYVWELIDALEKLPFDAVVKLRVKDSQDKEHYSMDSDHKRVLNGLAKQVFMPHENGPVIIDAWPKAPEHKRDTE